MHLISPTLNPNPGHAFPSCQFLSRLLMHHDQLTPFAQFEPEVSTPHILYACLGGFVVFVRHFLPLLSSPSYSLSSLPRFL
jgi:hypothetical protein